ncbi:MAG: carbohydrate binding family 9 domain-containing protein [Acidobacteria bacterium]|nr:carbohydrate binding family 9 domain-containing protein [Acidobacteriota bacterium]
MKILCALAVLLVSAPAWAQSNATAVAVTEAPTLDGDVLGDSAWKSAPVISGFLQEQPDEGQLASENTEVRIVFTRDTLYIGVVCYDRDPSAIIVSDSRRDAGLDETDSFRLIFDTYRDRQNGFVFGTNPAAIEYDGQVTNEGQGGGGLSGNQQTGSGGGFNLNWDAAWEVRTRIDERGWTAEFAIPFRTLRFPSGANQTWGMNFQRNIRRRNERSYWAPIPRQYNLYRLSLAGTVSGIQTPTIRSFRATPYVLGSVVESGARPVNATTLGDVGADFKYTLTPSLTLDATINTDFAQVEVDDQQVNLDRFSLFFPEKRPFFLENAGFFSVGNPGEIDLFFSRRIGIGAGGESIPIIGGGRVSGKAGPYNIGLLNMQTDDYRDRLPSNNFSVMRISRDFPNRSSIGGMFVNRDGTGGLAMKNDHNRTYALDGKWGVGQNTVLSSFVARTDTPGITDDDYAFNVRSRTNVSRFDLEMGYQEVGDGFNPQVGFLSRRGYRKPDIRLNTRWRPSDFLNIQEMRPHATYRSFWGHDGFQETGYVHIDNHWQFRNAYEVHTGMNMTLEGVRTPFEIYPGIFVPPGTYEHKEAQVVLMTNQGAPVSVNVQTFVGGFFGGDRVTVNPTLRMRLGEALSAEVSYQRNDVDLPVGSFITNLVRSRVSYSFNPRTFVQGLVQYNDRADLWSMNFRFGWLQAANTGLFIVYTDTRGLYDLLERPERTDRSLIVKFSRMFDVLR